MRTGALAERAAGSEIGERRGSKDQRVDRSRPPWRAWRTRSRAARAIRFIETYCKVPSGIGAGELIRLHRYQRESLEVLLAPGVRTGGEQIPRGNAKSTLWAAVGLWALCDHPDSPQVPLVAFNSLQAQRTLMRPVRSMVRACPELEARVAVYTATNDRRAWSAWNDGELLPLPADPEKLQGLNPTVALIDEAQTLPPAVLSAVLQGAGKRAASLVLAIGTPAPAAQDSALFALREQAMAGAPVAWVEYAAPAGCAMDDRAAWAAANPALRAGLLHADVLESELTLVTEAEFRCYRLGQWVDAVVADWLPVGAWEACPQVEAPPAGSEVVLGLAATWTSSVAIVGATLDGALFVAWAAETATDDELAGVLDTAREHWQVVEVVVAPRCRANLVARLGDDGAPVEVWPNRVDLEVESATEWRRAIIEGRVAHDHHPLLAEHVAASVARSTSDGSLRLVPPDDGRPVDAARAARMAWSRAVELGEDSGVPLHIY
jgi:phage terminase large subunit-like protein